MPNKNSDYHNYSHNNPSISTMGGFVSESDSIGIGLDIAQLLIYEDEFGRKNIDKLDDLYTSEEHNKYSSLMDKIRNTKPKQEKDSTQSSNNTTVDIESTIPDTPIIVPYNQAALQAALTTPGVESAYLTHSYISDISKLNTLFSKEVKLLFQKFIYRVETETVYYVKITSSKRTLEQQRAEVSNGNKKASIGFSYHLAGLAIDINLILKSGANPSMSSLTSLSDKEEWELSGVPKIARDLRLRWGDDFQVIDLIHFDARNYYKVDTKRFLDSIGQNQSEISQQQSLNELPSTNSLYSDLPLPLGVQFSIPISTIDRDVLSTETNQVVNTVDFESFLAKQLIDLMSSDKYKATFEAKSKPFKGTVQEIFPYISVWIWSRSLSISSSIASDGSTQYDHKIINVTPYVLNLNTNVTESGGNFNIALAPITADLYNQNNQGGGSFLNKSWKISEGTMKGVSTKNKDYVNHSFMHYIDNDSLKRNRMYFEKVLQYNDVVFIKFEELELEKKERRVFNELETISINDLPNQVFDMIGLIDDVKQDIQHDNVDVNISVSGRDLVKLLIEDGVYFYPTEFTSDGIFANTGATNTRLGRFGKNGEYLNRFQSANKTVDRSLKFIINNLGAIEICPGSLFDGYQNSKLDITKPFTSDNIIDKRSKAYQLTDEQKELTNKQQKSNNSDVDSILSKISKIQKVNNISMSDNEAFDIIQKFIQERIDKNEIEVLNQKIKSWTVLDNGVTYDSYLPVSLSDLFYISELIWTDEKYRSFLNFSDESIIVEKITSMYNSADKKELSEANLPLFKNLSKKSKLITGVLTKDKYENTIPFSSMLDELDVFLKQSEFSIQNIIKADDVNTLRELYSNVQSVKGIGGANGIINLNIVLKKFKDLSQEQIEVFNDTYNLLIKKQSQKSQPSNKSQLPLAGIWQIIKLVVDDSVKDRRLTDSSIGNENGSILNAFRKICQDPFCEFYTDTYGDQFYFIARKKPFDKESILSVMKGRAKYENIDPVVSQFDQFGSSPQDINSTTIVKQDLIIDIDDKDIITESLGYSTEAYSWYKLQLNNLTSGSSSDLAFAYLKAIYFDEFADIYGSKPLDLSTSYIPYSPIIDKNKKLPTAYFIRQGIYDLKYMIESHAHLPFTRMGNIVMNGERRIKRGNFVRLKSTSEIFYVDSVNNSYGINDKSIDRTTSIQVSRGMVERFIDENNNAAKISYFNICSLPIDESIFTNVNSAYSDFSKASISKWKVNKVAFNFFLKKLQFSKNDSEIFNDSNSFSVNPNTNNIA